MILSIKEYRHHKEMILDYFNTKGIDYIAFVCSVSYVPVIAAYSFILEEYPNDVQIKNRLDKALEFYDYIKVEG